MNTFFRLAAPLLLIALSACSAPKTAPQAETLSPIEQGCNAASVTHLQGLSAVESNVEHARQESGSSRTRVIAPNAMVTLDYDSERLNLNVDAGNLITSVSCG